MAKRRPGQIASETTRRAHQALYRGLAEDVYEAVVAQIAQCDCAGAHRVPGGARCASCERLKTIADAAQAVLRGTPRRPMPPHAPRTCTLSNILVIVVGFALAWGLALLVLQP